MRRSVREWKQNKAFSPSSLLLLPPNKELLHLTGSHRFQRRRKNSISLSQQSSSGGSSFPSAPYLCLWGGRTDCGCLQLAAAGTSLVGPHHHGTNTGDSARSRLPRLCCCTPTHPGGGKRHIAILFYCNFLDFVLLFPYFNLWTLPSHFWLTKHHTHNWCDHFEIFSWKFFVFGRLSHAKTSRTDCVHGFGTHVRQRSVNCCCGTQVDFSKASDSISDHKNFWFEKFGISGKILDNVKQAFPLPKPTSWILNLWIFPQVGFHLFNSSQLWQLLQCIYSYMYAYISCLNLALATAHSRHLSLKDKMKWKCTAHTAL